MDQKREPALSGSEQRPTSGPEQPAKSGPQAVRKRLVLNDRCELVDGDGDVIGRLIGLEVEIEPRTPPTSSSPPKEGSSENVNVNDNGNSNVKSKEAFGKESDEVAEVWDFYGQLISSRRQLGPKQRQDIERALKVRDIETIKLAIVGLANSPHHNGKNDSGTKYLDIRYALRGNGARGESNDERIDRMAQLGRNADGVRAALLTSDGFVPARQLSESTRRYASRELNSVNSNARPRTLPDDFGVDPEFVEEQRVRALEKAITELREGFGVEVRISDDGKDVAFKETRR